MLATQPFNTKTFETLNSNDSLLGGMSGALGGSMAGVMAGSFTSNLSKRMADAMQKHTSL